MIIWKGVNIFPTQIESVLMNIPEIKGSYMVVLETDNSVDRMTVKIEVGDAYLVGEKSEQFREQIVDMLQSELLVKAEIQFVPVGTISVSEDGKAKRVIDKRIL